MKFKDLFMNKDILYNKPCFSYLHFAPKFSGVTLLLCSWFLFVQEFRLGTEGMACVCSMMSRASAKKTQHLGMTWWIGLGIITFPCLVFDAGCGLGPHLGIWSKSGLIVAWTFSQQVASRVELPPWSLRASMWVWWEAAVFSTWPWKSSSVT